MVMAQTLFKLLKQRDAKISIHVLAPERTAPLLSNMPEVEKTIVSPFRHGELKLRARYRFAKSLRKANYQQAIIIPESFKSALIPFWARIPKRTGWRGEMRWLIINDMRFLNKNELPLTVKRFAALALEKNEPLPEELPVPVLQITANLKTPKQPILAICPGAEYGPAKRWPAEYFVEVAKDKLKQGWRVWLFGSKKDVPISAKIRNLTDNSCIDLTGKTSLQTAINLLSVSTTVVSNDSGLMHITAALGRQVVVIYGSSSPQFTPPLTKKAKIVKLDLPCQPCFKRECPLKHFKCMRDLSPEMVVGQVSTTDNTSAHKSVVDI